MCEIDENVNSMLQNIAAIREGVKLYGHQLTILESIWDNVPAIMFFKDEQNNIIKVNSYFCKVLGLDKSDIEGKNVNDLMNDKIQARKYAQNDLIVIKSNKPKIGIVETLFDSSITVRTDKFPVRINSMTRGVFGFSVILKTNGQQR